MTVPLGQSHQLDGVLASGHWGSKHPILHRFLLSDQVPIPVFPDSHWRFLLAVAEAISYEEVTTRERIVAWGSH